MQKINAIKGAIFDLDGVLVDTAKYHYLAWKKLAQSFKVFGHSNYAQDKGQKITSF